MLRLIRAANGLRPRLLHKPMRFFSSNEDPKNPGPSAEVKAAIDQAINDEAKFFLPNQKGTMNEIEKVENVRPLDRVKSV